jgi:hypothetical protein
MDNTRNDRVLLSVKPQALAGNRLLAPGPRRITALEDYGADVAHVALHRLARGFPVAPIRRPPGEGAPGGAERFPTVGFGVVGPGYMLSSRQYSGDAKYTTGCRRYGSHG